MHSQRLGPEHPRSLNSLRRDAWPDCTPAQESQRDFAARETRRGLAFLPRERAAIDSLKTSGLRVVDRGDDRGNRGSRMPHSTDFPAGKVLFLSHCLIASHKDFHAVIFRRAQKLAVLERRPAFIAGRKNFVRAEVLPQPVR